jgi:hypothetical protein
VFSDRDSRQLGRPNPENAGGQDAKNLRVKVFYAKFINFENFFFCYSCFQHGFILLYVSCRFEEVSIVCYRRCLSFVVNVRFGFLFQPVSNNF